MYLCIDNYFNSFSIHYYIQSNTLHDVGSWKGNNLLGKQFSTSIRLIEVYSSDKRAFLCNLLFSYTLHT